MTENATITTDAPTSDATKAKKKPASSQVTLSSVYAKVAAKRDISTTDAAKRVRGVMRANFDEVCKLSPNVTKAKKSANDGNRWPTHISRKLADRLTK